MLISYRDAANGLMVAKSGAHGDGGSWSSAASSLAGGQYTAIASDPSYNLYITHFNSGLYIAKSADSGSSWSNPVTGSLPIDATATAGQYTSMATLSDGTIIVVYYDTAGKLKFASSSNGGADW